ncbi:Six-hairpin glycosidase [Schizophyllum commune H4-8]|uniref:Six-hairpin glycosidase n=1 Tax=Schizophyllum commune (strain H4-8 / FGSC 9210) TaxID=578458 RepID=UPI00215ECA2F|nr:Six-hairpin glycosidase [Schizophyllum commune H4-8]KAI5888942.1 Six-hairpin glycosidase [Schizophyllum commune H4-8]
MRMLAWLTLGCGLSIVTASAPSGPWDDFNYAPSTRTVSPIAIYKYEGNVQNPEGLLGSDAQSATLNGAGAWIAVDFGKEVGGVISVNIDSEASSDASLALTFTESPLFVNPLLSDDSSISAPNMSVDGALSVSGPLAEGLWTQPVASQRGGFRYLTISLTTGETVALSNVSCAITFMPHVEDLRDYSGYFYAPDPEGEDEDLLTKIWYSGAYTIQTNIIAADEGRVQVYGGGWRNNGTIASASPVIVDGAKRDRTVWPGDMGIAGPAAFVALNDLVSVRNSLDEIFSLQDSSSGGLPCSGPLISCAVGRSDTYHAWSLVGAYNCWLHSGDTDWMVAKWDQYQLGIAYLAAKVDSNVGLLNATGSKDWGRLGGGGFSLAPNALYYKVLLNGAEIASALGNTETADNWLADAAGLKAALNAELWDEEAGLYFDNTTTTLHPQDGNSLVAWFNATSSDERKTRVSEGLTGNWVEVGAVAPELPDNVAPFAGSMEVHAHFAAGEPERALDFIRLQWGWMLTTNVSVQSTLLEGYTSNGSLLYRSYAGYTDDPSYISHSHGWSAGPTPALTSYLLGLTLMEPGGSGFRVQPQTAGLPAAEGGFETPLGWFGVSWSNDDAGGRFHLNVTAPEGTTGVVVLPFTGVVSVDGMEVGSESSLTLNGGTHSIGVEIQK